MTSSDPSVPLKIAKYYGLSQEDITEITFMADVIQHQKTLEKRLKDLYPKSRIMWYKDRKENGEIQNLPICYFWTNNNFDVFGFCKLIVDDDDVITVPFNLVGRIVPYRIEGVF